MRFGVANRAVGGASLVLGTAVTIAGAQLPFMFAGTVGPALIPVLVGAGWMLCGLWLLIRPDAADETLDDLPDRSGALRIVLLLLVGVVSTALMQTLSYTLSALVLCFGVLSVMSDYSVLKRLIIALPMGLTLAALCLYVLQLPMPGLFY